MPVYFVRVYLLVLCCSTSVLYAVIEVGQVVEGRTAHLHCAHDTSLEHILLSGWWEAVWQRMYRPNTVAEMTSKASSSVVFCNTTPSTGEGNNFAVSLEMRSSAVIANAGVEQQDLYSCLFQDSTGQIISQCFVMLVVKKGMYTELLCVMVVREFIIRLAALQVV